MRWHLGRGSGIHVAQPKKGQLIGKHEKRGGLVHDFIAMSHVGFIVHFIHHVKDDLAAKTEGDEEIFVVLVVAQIALDPFERGSHRLLQHRLVSADVQHHIRHVFVHETLLDVVKNAEPRALAAELAS